MDRKSNQLFVFSNSCFVIRYETEFIWHYLVKLSPKCYFQHQFVAMGGRCGICGDAYDASPREHEAPGGKYANGIIVKQYKAGKNMGVITRGRGTCGTFQSF